MTVVDAVPVARRRTDWLDHAAGRRADPELFFPVAPAGDVRAARVQITAAKRVCHRCPVRRLCLNWALDNGPEAA